jgi:hypothetical protein
MQMLQYHRMRTAIQVNASPGRGVELERVQVRLRELLEDSGLFEEVEVEHTDDLDQLVIALCTFGPSTTEAAVAVTLERIWSDRLRFPFWEAHATLVEDGHVEFEAASRAGQVGHYVTVHLVAQRTRIPTQREVPFLRPVPAAH